MIILHYFEETRFLCNAFIEKDLLTLQIQIYRKTTHLCAMTIKLIQKQIYVKGNKLQKCV